MRAIGRSFLGLGLALLIAAVPVAAQREAPIKLSLGAGLTLPSGDFNDIYEMEWGGLGAVSYRPPVLPFAFRANLSLAQVKDETPLDLSDRMLYGTANLLYEFDIPETVVRPYLLGGAGIYNFNPGGDAAAGIGSETRFGVNAGIGLEVKPGQIGFFAESRLHHVIDPGDDVQFGAVVAGLRFGAF